MFFVPFSLSTVLYAVGSGESHRLADRFRLTVYTSLGFGVVSNLALLVLGTPLLEIFGSSYANEASGALHVLAIDIFPSTVLTHYVALRRIERRLPGALPIIWGGALLQVGGGVVGAILDGLVGVAIGWVLGATMEALAMSPEVLRALRATHLAASEAPDRGAAVDEAIAAEADFNTVTGERF
jgi:Na+-driven multidrug efflux pump